MTSLKNLIVSIVGAGVVTDFTVAPTFNNFGVTTNEVWTAVRMGSRLFIRGQMTTGTCLASPASIVFSEFDIDTDKLTIGAAGQRIGEYQKIAGSGATYTLTGAIFFDGDTDTFYFAKNNVAGPAYERTDANAIMGTGDIMDIEIDIPVSGWT